MGAGPLIGRKLAPALSCAYPNPPATARPAAVCSGVHETVLGLRYFDMALQRTSGECFG